MIANSHGFLAWFQSSSKHNPPPSSLKIRPFRNRLAYRANSPTPLCQGHQRTRRQGILRGNAPVQGYLLLRETPRKHPQGKSERRQPRRSIPSRNTASGRYSRKGCWCRNRYSSFCQYGGMQGPSFRLPGRGIGDDDFTGPGKHIPMAAPWRKGPVHGIRVEEHPVTARSGLSGIIVAHFRHPHHQPGLAGINKSGAVFKPVFGFLGVSCQYNHANSSGAALFVYTRYGFDRLRKAGCFSASGHRICR